MNQQAKERTTINPSPTSPPFKLAQGVVQRVDTVGREIVVLLSTGIAVFDVPPDCPIFLNGDRVKLRMIQPRDQARITYASTRGMLVVKLLEAQPDSGFSCFRM